MNPWVNLVLWIVTTAMVFFYIWDHWHWSERRSQRRYEEGLVAGATETKREYDAELADLVSEIRLGIQPRFEIEVTDFGVDYLPDMRFRWNIWDADRLLVAQAAPEAYTGPGIEYPFMLGNAQSAAVAIDQAVRWLEANNTAAPFVVTT